MKICFLSRYQNGQIRGAEVFVNELAKRLVKNHHVEVLSGIEADSWNKVISSRYDVVIPINGRGQSLKTSFGRLIGGYKVLISGHSGVGWDDLWNIAVGKPDVFVALTSYMEDWARKWAWGSKVVKIADGVDLNKFSPKGKKIDFDIEKPIILSVGALTWYKHHELAINAVSYLSQGSLLIVGRGELKEKLSNFGEKKLGKRFKLINADYEEMPNIYRSADLFTLPSWPREAFGLVYLEAMASGLPVVAPNDLARKEIIGGAGVLCDVNNAFHYVAAIEKALGENFKQVPCLQASKFSWDIISEKYNDIFLSLEGR